MNHFYLFQEAYSNHLCHRILIFISITNVIKLYMQKVKAALENWKHSPSGYERICTFNLCIWPDRFTHNVHHKCVISGQYLPCCCLSYYFDWKLLAIRNDQYRCQWNHRYNAILCCFMNTLSNRRVPEFKKTQGHYPRECSGEKISLSRSQYIYQEYFAEGGKFSWEHFEVFFFH